MFAITPDAPVRYAKLRTNECQIARYPNPADSPAMRANPDLKVQEAEIAGATICFNNTKKPFDDRRVRLGTGDGDRPRPDLVKAVFQGGGDAGGGAGAAVVVGPQHVAEAIQVRSGGGEEAADRGWVSERFSTDLWAIPVVRYMPNGRRAAEMI